MTRAADEKAKEMSSLKRRPGQVRDAIVDFLLTKQDATLQEIRAGVASKLGGEVPASSVRSYLNNNTPTMFERTGRGHYRLRAK